MSNAVATDDPARWLQAVAADDPQRPFLETEPFATEPARRLSYGDMWALTRRLAASLASLQVAPGDRIVAQIEKSPEAIALYLACLQLGATFVPLNTAYTFAELEYFLGDAAPSVAVVRLGDRSQIQSI